MQNICQTRNLHFLKNAFSRFRVFRGFFYFQKNANIGSEKRTHGMIGGRCQPNRRITPAANVSLTNRYSATGRAMR